MTGEQLRAFRKAMGMKQADFGAWLAERLSQDRPYAPSEVSSWEKGHRPVSYQVQAVVYRELWLDALGAESRIFAEVQKKFDSRIL